jgi:GRIP and coiled-coil domain-containing protein 2
LELDDSRLELSRTLADREKLCGSLETEKNKLTKQVYSLEDALETLRLQFNEKEQECEDIKTEFASYKIRAQSVLRNQTTRDTGRDQEMAEEITMLQQSIEKANQKLTNQQESIEVAGKNLEELQSDKQRLQARCKELMELIEESRAQNEHLMEETKKQTRDYQDGLKSQRLQYETLNNCYKQQIKDLEDKHVKELENLSKRQITQASADPTPSYPVNSDEHKINLILMEREEGEGSESSQQQLYTSSTAAPLRKISTSSRGKRELMPLDELLSTSIPDESVVDSGEYDRSVSPTIELKQTHAQLQVQESRVKHLTALLAEAEQDLAKLTQLNELLKEEVRRQERSLERSAGLEQHVHNSEYLKNVIFKVRR